MYVNIEIERVYCRRCLRIERWMQRVDVLLPPKYARVNHGAQPVYEGIMHRQVLTTLSKRDASSAVHTCYGLGIARYDASPTDRLYSERARLQWRSIRNCIEGQYHAEAHTRI